MDVRDTDNLVVGAGERDQAQKLQTTSIDRMSLGKASLVNFECYVMPVDYLESYSQKPIDGILGADALARSKSLLSVANAGTYSSPRGSQHGHKRTYSKAVMRATILPTNEEIHPSCRSGVS